ncbi:hypothetical protein [Arthrobacter sp. VKM Ac-2550]|uniref:hypothetical protein n=1 Tax=Crystallibacter permensis TaxID=1938888 RepID=UPI002227E098|nr:hypothetical protein [Arthrobacter sp. VKM Ac-2550]MCW2131239.1 hypothetical protein [Arthrobacter sp. VKM Ac-2550]
MNPVIYGVALVLVVSQRRKLDHAKVYHDIPAAAASGALFAIVLSLQNAVHRLRQRNLHIGAPMGSRP